MFAGDPALIWVISGVADAVPGCGATPQARPLGQGQFSANRASPVSPGSEGER